MLYRLRQLHNQFLGFEFRPIDPSGQAEEIAVMVSVADNQN